MYEIKIEAKTEHNFKRSNTISSLKRKNFELARQIAEYTIANKLLESDRDILLGMQKALNCCCNNSLYSQSNEKLVYYGSIDMCKRKTCFICNWNRQKSIRRKYVAWFQENSFLVRMDRRKNGRFQTKVVTKAQVKKFQGLGWQVLHDQETYDLMHLTLTVPHNADGFNGDKYYFAKIQQAFKQLRKKPFWDDYVLGGEYGIEATAPCKKEIDCKDCDLVSSCRKHKDFEKVNNGYNIHIHSLIFVKKETQNRNTLHRLILKEWNELTVNHTFKRDKIEQWQYPTIKKGNSTLTDQFIKELDPKGSTFIGLENIYSLSDNGDKIRSEHNKKTLMRAVMETISYHFEPLFFDKDKNQYDVESLADILPKIFNKPLYEKFGCLRGEKSLNIYGKDAKEDMMQGVEESRIEIETENGIESVSIDPETGEILETNKTYFVCNPAYIFHNPDSKTIHLSKRAREKIKNLDASCFIQALDQVVDMMKAGFFNKAERVENNYQFT